MVSSDRGYARAARRDQAQVRRQREEADGTAEAKRAELAAAKEAWAARIATPEQKALVRRHEDAVFFAERYASAQSPVERIHGPGFHHPGGWVVEGKVWRDEFWENGLRTWRHPFFRRVLASMGKASRGDLRTGDTKDGCHRQWSKLHGSDKLYGFFSVNCRDMWRLDCEEVFKNESELRSWIAYRLEESDAPCGPHMAVSVPDSRYPGIISKPHLFFLAPEGHAVWPTSPDSHHRLLGNVIAALTQAFECDEGGLANPFHGKIPLSPFTEAIVLQDTCMPTLGEYADHMKLSFDPQLMFRKMSVARLEEVGFDPSESNTWFSLPATLATSTGRRLYHEGFNVANEDAFQERIEEIITPDVIELINPSGGKQLKTVAKMIKNCARWTARRFDPKKIGRKVKDRGAIAHQIEPTDDIGTRQRKGQTYVAEKRSKQTQVTLKPLYKERRKRGATHTRTEVSRVTARCYNTIKRHEFECEIAAVAELLVEICGLVAVKGVHHPSLSESSLLNSSAEPFRPPVVTPVGLPPPADPGIRL